MRRGSCRSSSASTPRVFHGVVAEVQACDILRHQMQDFAHYRVRLVSRLWLLSQQTNSRVFQRKRVDEVVRTVLDEALIPHLWLLKREYPERELCVQYEETDLQFISRLLAENGIFFFFEQPPWSASDVPDLVQQGIGIATAAVQQVAGHLFSGAAGIPSGEVMILADDPLFYAPLSNSPEQLVDALRQQVEQLAASAIGADVLGPIREGLGLFSSLTDSAALHYRPDSDAMVTADVDTVRSFSQRGAVRPMSAHFRDVDPRRPLASLSFAERHSHDLGESLTQLAHGLADLDVAEAVQGAAGVVGDVLSRAAEAEEGHERPHKRGPLEVYDHHTQHLFPDWDYKREQPKHMLKSARRDAKYGLGGSICPRLASGHRFRLEGHPLHWLDADYVVTEVEHRGHAHETTGSSAELTYENTFRCVPSAVCFVPSRPPRRTVQTCVTATVVATGHEIHTAEYAMIKVKFHWDRRPMREETTCWIRTMQPWAGAGWGTQFIPREGMEVVVGFDGGDVDKPIVLGCLYNGVHPAPFPLPNDKTRSGIRTRSTPDGNSGNELSFEDNRGNEQIFMHAERDLDIEVQHDRSLRVTRNDRNEVHGEQRLVVQQEQRIEVRGGRSVTVSPQQRHEVDGDDNVVVRGDRDLSVTGDQRVTVSGGHHLTIGQSSTLETSGDYTSRHSGSRTELVGSHDAPRGRTVRVEGASLLSSSQANTVSSEAEVVLRCGASFLRIAPDRIEISSPMISLQGENARLRLGEDDFRAFAKGRLIGIGDTVMWQSSGAAVGMTSEVAVDGSRILLNSPESADDPQETEESEPTTIELTDDEGNPIPYQEYRIELDDGSAITGVLDRDGRAVIDLEQQGQVRFPGLTDVEVN